MSAGLWALALLFAAGACGGHPEAVDLLESAAARLTEASVEGRNLQWVQSQIGRPRRIRDVVRATLPATPPSRLVFVVDVPRDGRLALAPGMPRPHRRRPAVEFVVKVRREGRETTLWSRLVDPANRPEDRGWVPLEVDLSEHAGRGVELVLETRGYDEGGSRAFWGTPAITTAEDTDAPLVVVYLVDTLRADHLSLYGYERDTSLELERFARDAVVFDQAIAPSSWTKPSVASLFTSLLPAQHRCVQFYTPLDRSFVTFAEMLQERGYGTGAVVTNELVLAREAHYDQGFEYFARPPEPQSAREVVDAALEYLTSRRGLPTLLYLHTMDPHWPYAPPPPFDRRYPPPPAPGRAAAGPYDYEEPLDLDRIVAQYDGEVAYGDGEFGRFVRELEAQGLYERSLIVFLSDHGEEFLDHGDWMHGHTLFEELVRVPLVVKYPGNRHAGRRVARQVLLVDVLPTILAGRGRPSTSAAVGRPLEEAFAGGTDGSTVERPAILETKYREYVAYGVRTPVDKYVHHINPVDHELYLDLVRDPLEREGPVAHLGARARDLRRIADEALTPAAFRYRLRVAGEDHYDLLIRTSGWIHDVDAVGLGPDEHARVEDDRQRLTLRLAPHGGRPREVSVLMIPHGAPLWLEGTRDGRPLRARDIRVGAKAIPARVVPFEFPDVEEAPGAFSPPPAGVPGIDLWLSPAGSGPVPEFDTRARERLEALGYLQ
jgi:arylsulfatase A-like enzyme